LSLFLFLPCFVDQAAPHLGELVLELLDRLQVPGHYPAEQTCCGQFAWTLGDLATARRLMRHFFKVFSQASAILCPSASCTLMVRCHYPSLAESAAERDAALALAARTWELSEWLAARGQLPWTPRHTGSLVLHRSCKSRQLGALPGAVRLLSQVAGLNLQEISPYYSCCGFGGVFKALHPDISRTVGATYLHAVAATGAGGLVSLDPSCLLHLQSLSASLGYNLTFSYLAEVLLANLRKRGF
jgi:L-lactate dehydrogenase complex protein LldE